MSSHNARKQFLSPEKMDEAVTEVAAIAKSEGIRIAVIGGYAMQLYGSDRLTSDVDFAADSPIPGLRRGRRLTFGGTQTQSSAGVPIDIVVRDDAYEELYDEVISLAKRIRGVPVPVATPEHLAAMKMAAGRDGKDHLDLAFLIVSGATSTAKARRIIERHLGEYAAREFDLLVDEFRWRHSRGR